MTEFWSSERVRGRNAIIQIDTDMQHNYAALKAELINHLSPVIIVNNDAKGGEYTLIFNGKRETLHPIAVTFELAKSVAHVPLGIFTLIAPYLNGSDTTDWVAKLSEFSRTLQTAKRQLRSADIPDELEISSRKIIKAGVGYIDKTIESGQISIKEFKKFTASIHDNISTNMRFAADAQIKGVSQTLERWKKEIGDRHWKNLYVVVLSIWTTSVLNQNSIIIRDFMNPKQVDTHLIDLPTAQTPDDYIYVALDNLARIVQDNVAAELVFPTDEDLADALKGTQDLLSEMILGMLDDDSSNNKSDSCENTA
ncbi:hypothetical protein FIC94_11575 [Ochrobactrum teleogrylli]|uniref:Uncharacterized protein n=2 Tax=Ochrobactrum teleogrylli TaxID=2479765 RepID=A0ABY2Y6F1_9HYPH|nr:hypothetical protein FIC94_11575 [[Ochrobactrum] teleogrylli]